MDLTDKKILIAYFSQPGQHYVNGAIRSLPVGNTSIAARMLREITGGSLFFIDTQFRYPDDHMKKVGIAQKEKQEQARPPLTDCVPNMNAYDTVFLCYPNWWETCPMAVFTFLESYDFTGKIIAPLCTNEGSGLSSSVEDIRKTCPTAKVTDGLSIRGGKVREAGHVIKAWVQGL